MYRIMALESNDPSAELAYILARKLPGLCPPSPGTIDNNEWHAIFRATVRIRGTIAALEAL
jgi:hypothetical protein